MNDRQLAARARARAERAREREARALAHRRAAAEKARHPESTARDLREAELYGRAASLHRQAIELQVRHALAHEPSLEHESSPDTGATDPAGTAAGDRLADGQASSLLLPP